MMYERIGVSGNGGYIGTILTKMLLEKGYKVLGMDNMTRGHCDGLLSVIGNPNFEFMYGDVTDVNDCKKFLSKVDGVIHLAGLVGAPICEKHKNLSRIINYEATKLLIDNKKSSTRFIFPSTGSVYGKIENGLCDESSPTIPLSRYGIDKLDAEHYVSQYGDNSVSFRLSTVCGVSPVMRLNLLLHDLLYQGYTNKSLTIFQADFRRSFVAIKDVCRAFIFALENDMKHKVYNCGDETMNLTKRQVAELVKERTGCLVTYAEIGKDLDQRDYEVSSRRLREENFHCQENFESTFEELMKAMPLLKINHQYQ